MTSKNSNLHGAKQAKNDEFYTQYHDIEKEMQAYLDYNPDVFRDKVILLPCDDPEWSNFTRYFAQRFTDLGLKKLISTSYVKPKENEDNTELRGKIFTLTRDLNKDGVVDIKDLEWEYLQGDGDFRSEEVTKLRDEADMIITNPPFSLFREFLVWIVEGEKIFNIIGNKNAITYKEVFLLIMKNKVWLGMGDPSDFNTPYGITKNVNGLCRWFTNIEHGRRHQPLDLDTMENNLRFNNSIKKNPNSYKKYDNYDAIEVPRTDGIPSDYDGVMGVPISFMDKYCPEQFEIIGTSDNGLIADEFKTTQGLTQDFVDDYYKDGGTGAYKAGNPTAGIYNNGIAKMIFKRIFIRHKTTTAI